MADYPASVPTIPATGWTHAQVADEIMAIASTLGVNPQGGFGSVVARLAALIQVGASRAVASATDTIQSFTIEDDGSATGSWPNRLEWFFQPNGGAAALVQWVNEYGELRLTPAKVNTVAFRIFAKLNQADAAHTGPVFEVTDARNPAGSRTTVASIDGAGNVTAANLPSGVYVIENGAANPAGAGDGAVILEKAAP